MYDETPERPENDNDFMEDDEDYNDTFEYSNTKLEKGEQTSIWALIIPSCCVIGALLFGYIDSLFQLVFYTVLIFSIAFSISSRN